MKFFHLLTLFLFINLGAIAQKPAKDKYSMPFKKVKDTTFAYSDQSGTVRNVPGMPYIKKSWPENGKWKSILLHQPDNQLAGYGWYKDPDLEIKDGVFEYFYENGKTQSTTTFSDNKREGTYVAYYEDGKPMERYTFKQDMPVDSAFDYYEDGSVKFRGGFNQTGTGSGTEYYKGGKIKLWGNIKEGKRDGTWQVQDENGTKIMEASFLADSLTKTTCFTADGKPVSKGECIFEKPATFPGGDPNWMKFLQKNLKYPNDAFKKGIQGVVRVQFIVDKDGSVKESVIVSSPDKSLSNEVLRLMKNSPDWIPAIQYNKPVIYRHIQAVTFSLE